MQIISPLVRSASQMGSVVVMALALSSSVSAQTPGHVSSSSKASAGGTHKDMHSPDMRQSMERMSQQMASSKMSGDADRDFATMMRIHHQGAIDMAEAQLATGKDPEMRKLAKEIISAQKKEIAVIDRWLKKYEKR